MYNQELIYDDSKLWYYTPVKYWPNGIDLANADNDPSKTAREKEIHKVSFFAYAPYTANATDGASPATINVPYTAFDWGDAPIGSSVVGDYFKTAAYTGTYPNGVIGMISYNGTASDDQSNDPWVNYVMAPESNKAQADEVVDLLWGLRGQYAYDETDSKDNVIDKLGTAYNTDLTKQSVDEKVRFLFKHALAKVGGNTSSNNTGNETKKQQCGLKVVLDVDANSTDPGKGSDNQSSYQINGFNSGTGNLNTTLVTIKSISIQDGTSASGDATNAVTDKQSDLVNVGWFNLATGEWTKQDIKEKITGANSPLVYNITADNATTPTYALDDDIKEPANATAVKALLTSDKKAWDQDKKPTGVKTPTPKNVYADMNGTAVNDIPALVMIPTDATKEQTLYVTVDYIVRTADTQLKEGYSEVEQIISNEVKLKGIDPNKYYTLVMHLGLTSVKFEAVVADWAFDSNAEYDENGTATSDGEAEEKSVWLPSNVVNTTSIYADAGTKHKKVTVADTQTSYELKLTGLTAGNSIEITGLPTGWSATPLTPVGVDGTLTTTITMTANKTKDPITTTLTIKDKNSDASYVEANETQLTIVQQKAEIILTPSVTSIAWNSGTFEITATHANGVKYTKDELNTSGVLSVVEAEYGTATATADGVITITPNNNTSTENRTIAITATPYTGVTATTKVVQAASTSPKLELSINDPETKIPLAGGSKTLTVKLSDTPATTIASIEPFCK